MSDSREAIARLLEPASVAVVGASDDISRIGGRPVDYLRRFAPQVALTPVNPRRPHVQGLAAVRSLDDLTAPVDLCIFATPAEITVELFEQHAGRVFGSALIFGGGFAEAGAAGAALQGRLQEVAADRSVAVAGPNCLGFASIESGIYATFASAFDELAITPGNTALLSQSGGFAINLLVEAASHSVGLSRMISTGNEAGVGFTDYLHYLADDPNTERIVGFMEGLRPTDDLGAALEAIQRVGKQLSIVKVGRSDAGRRSVASHTALAAGSDTAIDALFDRYDVTRLETVQQAIDVMQLPIRSTLTPITVATMSGGAAGYVSDLCADLNLPLRELTPSTVRRLQELLPGFGSTGNPVDLTGQVVNDPALFTACLAALDADGASPTLLFLGGLAHRADELIDMVHRAQRDRVAELAVCWLGVPEEVRIRARQRGLTVFDDPARLLTAWAKRGGFASASPTSVKPSTPRAVIGETEAMSWLAAAGVTVPRRVEVDLDDDLGSALSVLAGPVVMKVTEPLLAHRAAVGGVVLDLDGADAVRAAADDLRERLGARRVLLAEQIDAGAEILVGLLRDEAAGLLAMVGPGGVDANAIGGHLGLVPPIGRAYVTARLRRLPWWGEWADARGDGDRLADELFDLLTRLNESLDQHPEVAELEINPVRVTRSGIIALDALAIGSQP